MVPAPSPPSRLERLLGLVFSAPCPLCGSGRRGGRLCDDCFAALPRLVPPTCSVCALALEPAAAAADVAEPRCGPCLDGRAYTRALVLGPYTGTLREAVHRLKFQGRRALAHDLGRRLGVHYAAALPSAALVAPVPLARARRRERGYNQAEILAEGLARALGARCLPRALERPEDRPPQTGLGWAARHANVRGAFRARSKLVRGRSVIVVDDVITTGATVEAAARALQRAGAGEVWVAALARTP